VVVLLGGHDKGTQLSSLAHAVSSRCKAAVCYGEAGPRIAQALADEDGDMGLIIREAPHMSEALEVARTLACKGDVVLLSPACSSFDEFKSYRQRGETFKEMVGKLGHKEAVR
jgi:UDP-N-acetylmuramoylalanine--D-glutamate ligase